MKTTFRLVIPLIMLSSIVIGLFGNLGRVNIRSAQAQTTSNPIGPTGSTWTMTFNDEFNGTALNRTVWRSDIPNGGNGELQEYVNDDSRNNYLVHDDMLQIVARKELYSGQNYTSGVILTQGRFSQKYGFFEMRAKIPAGKGLWPAFWMLADPWTPEIDIMEILADRPSTAFMTFHYYNSAGTRAQTQTVYTGTDFSSGWHTFGVDWQPNALVWYIDGIERKRVTDTSIIPNVPMWILANLAVGGAWPGNPDSTTFFPAYMDIDYIRAWQKTGSATSSAPTATKAATATPISNATSMPTTNMVLNPSYENAGASPWNSPWTFRNDLGATFSQDTSTAANSTWASAKAYLPSANSSQPWLVSMTQSNKVLNAGQSYTLSFWAKASAARSIRVIIQDQNAPYTEFYKQTANLTSTWTRYAYTFTAPASVPGGMLNFNLADTTGTVWIDEVTLCPGNCTGPVTVPPTATLLPAKTITPVLPFPTATARPTEVLPVATATFPAIQDTTPPGVTITSPLNNINIKRRSSVTISANASDNFGVAKVDFYVNGSLLCTQNNAPYSCTWNVPGARDVPYTIEARAYDASQNMVVSSVQVITVR